MISKGGWLGWGVHVVTVGRGLTELGCKRTDLLGGGAAGLQVGPDRVALGAQRAGEEGGACGRQSITGRVARTRLVEGDDTYRHR
jgi:hypothetical protein